MVRTKVFVGNLSFKTHEKDLAKEFEAAGKVASASIISRGNRSLGYGFVEMESEEEAKKSVELLNKKNIDNREINVEIARPREEKPPADPSAPASSGDGTRGRGRRPYRGGRRGGPRRGPKPEGAGGEGGAPAAGGEGGAAPRAPRPRSSRPPRNDADKAPRTPSQDTLFVTNLPFSVDDASLAAIFADMNIKTAHVVRKHNERSKGFGFVEFNSHDDQQKALNAINNKNVEGRELVVKVALTEIAKIASGGAPGSPVTAIVPTVTPASPAPAAGSSTTAAAAPASPAVGAKSPAPAAAAPASPAPTGK